MEKRTHDSGPANTPGRSYFWWLIGGCLAVLLVALLIPRPPASLTTPTGSSPIAVTDAAPDPRRDAPARAFSRPPNSLAAPAGPTAEQIVTNKVIQFARSRRKLMHDMAERLKVHVPPRLDQFFDTAESGKWEDLEAAFKSLSEYKRLALEQADQKTDASGEIDQELTATMKLSQSVSEMYGVAQAAHNWPAQRLLDYGNSILDSLRPGMVYLGGTDAGRYIPTLLNETRDGERHVVLTQNAFADGTYLEYARALYGDRLTTPSAEDSQRSFSGYLADAQKRFHHDQDFPNEPKQLLPGEDVRVTDNRVQVSGQVAVNAINERLVQILMEKNPGVPFAVEQGFPLVSTYSGATPLGPIMEIGAANQPGTLTAEGATEAVDYWRAAAQQFADTPPTDSLDARNAYAKMASEQATLLLRRDYAPEAEQAFRIANEISPANSEVVFRYADLLLGQLRFDDATRVVENAMKAAPENTQLRELADSLRKQKQK
jgi:tetratricopeptide (TPR) repeat protein